MPICRDLLLYAFKCVLNFSNTHLSFGYCFAALTAAYAIGLLRCFTDLFVSGI